MTIEFVFQEPRPQWLSISAAKMCQAPEPSLIDMPPQLANVALWYPSDLLAGAIASTSHDADPAHHGSHTQAPETQSPFKEQSAADMHWAACARKALDRTKRTIPARTADIRHNSRQREVSPPISCERSGGAKEDSEGMKDMGTLPARDFLPAAER